MGDRSITLNGIKSLITGHYHELIAIHSTGDEAEEDDHWSRLLAGGAQAGQTTTEATVQIDGDDLRKIHSFVRLVVIQVGWLAGVFLVLP